MEVSLSPRTRTVVLWAGIILGVLVLMHAAGAIKPFAWAIVTAYIFYPLVNFIHRKTRLPKHVITAWLYAMLALMIVLLIINFAPPLIDETRSLKDNLPGQLDRLQEWIDRNQGGTLAELGIEPDELRARVSDAATEFASGLGTEALPLLLHTVGFAIHLLVYLVASFYFIVYGDRFVASIRSVINRRYHNEFDSLLTEINSTLGAYIRGQAILVVIMSVASYIALYILDVEYALILAIATGFLELIPIVGPWTAGTIAVMVALFQDTAPFGWNNTVLAIVVGLTYFVLRQLEDTFVIPQVIGRIVHLHPLLVIFVVVVGTALGGLLGLVLAVPIAAVLKIIIQYLFQKITARDQRHIERITDPLQLEWLVDAFPEMVNSTVVLLVEKGTLDWNDMWLITKVVETARDCAIALTVVTTDPDVGALWTTTGVDTVTIPGAQTIVPSTMPEGFAATGG